MSIFSVHSMAADCFGDHRARFFPSSELQSPETWGTSVFKAEGFEMGAIWAPKDGAVAAVGIAVATFPCKIGDGDGFLPSPISLHSARFGQSAKTRLPFGKGKVASVSPDGLVLAVWTNGCLEEIYAARPYKRGDERRLPSVLLLETADFDADGNTIREELLRQLLEAGAPKGQVLELRLTALVKSIELPKGADGQQFLRLRAQAFAVHYRVYNPGVDDKTISFLRERSQRRPVPRTEFVGVTKLPLASKAAPTPAAALQTSSEEPVAKQAPQPEPAAQPNKAAKPASKRASQKPVKKASATATEQKLVPTTPAEANSGQIAGANANVVTPDALLSFKGRVVEDASVDAGANASVDAGANANVGTPDALLSFKGRVVEDAVADANTGIDVSADNALLSFKGRVVEDVEGEDVDLSLYVEEQPVSTPTAPSSDTLLSFKGRVVENVEEEDVDLSLYIKEDHSADPSSLNFKGRVVEDVEDVDLSVLVEEPNDSSQEPDNGSTQAAGNCRNPENSVDGIVDEMKPSSIYIHTTTPDLGAVAGDFVTLAWNGLTHVPAAEDKARAWTEIVSALALWSGFTFPVERGEEFAAFGPIPNANLLAAYGKQVKVKGVKLLAEVKRIKPVWREMPNGFDARDVLVCLSYALANPGVKVVTTYPARLLERVLGVVRPSEAVKLPSNIVVISPGWARIDRAALSAPEAHWVLTKMGIPVQGTPDRFSFRFEREEWVVEGCSVFNGGRAVRPQLAVVSVGSRSLVGADDMVVRTPVTALVMAMLNAAHLINLASDLNFEYRLWGAFEKAVLRELAFDDDQTWSYVEGERAAFVRCSPKTKFINGELPIPFLGDGFELPTSEKDELAAEHIPPHFLDGPALAHNLIHIHKGGCDLWMPAELAMTQMRWIPENQRAEYAVKAVAAAAGVDPTPAAVAEFIRKNLKVEGSDDQVLSWFAQEGVILFSTKESKLTKRIVLGRPNAIRPLGVERADRCELATERTIREEFAADSCPEGLTVRVLRAPHLTLPAGVALQLRRFWVEDEDTFAGEYDAGIGYNVLVPGYRAEIKGPTPDDVDYVWTEMPNVSTETVVMEIVHGTNDGIGAMYIRAGSTGRLHRLSVRQVFIGDRKVLKVTGTIRAVVNEIKGRSDGLKFMTASVVNGGEILALNAPHPQWGRIDADLIVPGDADKSDAMSIWMASAAVQSAEQLDAEGKPLFPELWEEVQKLRQATGCPTGGLVLPNALIGGGGLRPLFEAFYKQFGQFVWLQFVDSAVGPQGGNVVTLTARLLEEKVAAKKAEGYCGGLEKAPLSQEVKDVLAKVAPATATIITVHPLGKDWTNVYAFWVDERGQTRMVVRTWAYAGWEKAPLIEVIKAEGISVRKSVTSMRTMAGQIRGVALAGDKEFARRLAQGHEENLWAMVALSAMAQGKDLSIDGEPIEMVEVNETLQLDEIVKAYVESKADGRFLERLAEAFPRTAFRIRNEEAGDLTFWIPGVLKFGGADAKDSFVGLVETLLIYLGVLGHTPKDCELLLKRIKGRLRGLLQSENLWKSCLGGRPAAVCKTISSFGVPDGVFLVRYTAPSEPCWETSMYRQLVRFAPEGKVHGCKYLLGRPPITVGAVLRAQVVYPGDELWPLVADRPHITVIPIWAALADGGDNDGDTRPHVWAGDSSLPVTTCEDVLKNIETFTGLPLAEQETYLADQLLPKAGVLGRQPFGASKKSVKSLDWVRRTFSAATEFALYYGPSHELFHFVDCLCELLAEEESRPDWVGTEIVSIVAQIYETALGGYDPVMQKLIGEWLVPGLYQNKPGEEASLDLDAGDGGEAGLLRRVGLTPGAAPVLRLLLQYAAAGHRVAEWAKGGKLGNNLPSVALGEDERNALERAVWIAALTHVVSKGLGTVNASVSPMTVAYAQFLHDEDDQDIIQAVRAFVRNFQPYPAGEMDALTEKSVTASMLIRVARILMRSFALESDTYDISSVLLKDVRVSAEEVGPSATSFDDSMLEGLSPDQREAVEAIMAAADPQLEVVQAAEGPAATVLLLGGPGTGKSHTLRVALRAVRAKYGNRVNIVVTGSTGTAAQNITSEEFPARTLSSAFGLGANGTTLPAGVSDRGTPKPRKDTFSVASRPQVQQRLKAGEVLLVVIDEVSMASSEDLVLAYEVARLVRRDRPASIRFVLVGDFNQLPVVQTDDDVPANPAYKPAVFKPVGGQAVERKSLLESSGLLTICQLQTTHRQADNTFVRWANLVANGLKASERKEAAAYFAKFAVSSKRKAPVDALHIFPDNRRVQEHNQAMMEKLAKNKRVFSFEAIINDGQMRIHQAVASKARWIQEIAPIPLVLKIFVGCPVQFRVNEGGPNPRYANGTMGVVRSVDLLRRQVDVEVGGKIITVGQVQIPVEVDETGKPPVKVVQFPFVVAFAMTGHKVQGQTIDRPVVIHLADKDGAEKPVSTRGWAYVAMTRVKKPESQLFLACKVDNFLESLAAGDEERAEIQTALERFMSTS